MPRNTNRRQFLQTTAATGVGFWVAGGLQAQESKAANEQVQFACVGVGGKGSSDSADAGRHGKVVAICDVDEKRLGAAGNKFKGSKAFYDYRQMLDEMGDKIDAITVSTPDHNHAAASVQAMKQGIHCFCQKPLTHSIHEARVMADVAREKGVVTQMGNQGTAGSALRKAAAVIQAGAIGDVKEVHVWTNRPIWPQGGDRPNPSEAPSYLHWEEWIGPAPYREYGPGYHPFAWRGWWDFGTGALGDMACHTLNMPFMALDLRDPLSVQAESPGHNGDSYPKWSIITYEFGKRGDRGPLTMTWYDGGKRPSADIIGGEQPAKSGAAVIGSKGILYSPGDYGGSYKLIGDVEEPDVEFEKSPGHFTEWVRAIQGGPAAKSNFPEYSGGLTETVLLGNLAVWATGEKVEWDAENLKAKNKPELDKIVNPPYREGWSL